MTLITYKNRTSVIVMSHGPDTELAISAIQDGGGYIHLKNLNITSLPLIPDNTLTLMVTDTQINQISTFPSNLIELHLAGQSLSEIGSLPEGLHTLTIYNTQVRSLPPLPASLQRLSIVNCPITDLPHVSDFCSVNFGRNKISKENN